MYFGKIIQLNSFIFHNDLEGMGNTSSSYVLRYKSRNNLYIINLLRSELPWQAEHKQSSLNTYMKALERILA